MRKLKKIEAYRAVEALVYFIPEDKRKL